MPTLTAAGPTGIVDLAGRLSADLNAGQAPRESFGARDAAFTWASGLPMIVGRAVASAVVDGLSFNAVRVAPSATPAAKVAEGGTKPDAVVITADEVRLSKYAGLATVSTEQTLSTDVLMSALATTITHSCLLAFDVDTVAALDADAGETVTGASWAEAILAGIGAAASNGSAPSVLVLSASDYAAAVGAPGVGFALDPRSSVVSLFGLQVVISGSVAAGSGYVVDPAACMAVENASSPLAVIDPYSQLSTNMIRIAVEWFASFVVTSPAGVVKITATAPAGTRDEYTTAA